MKPCCQIGGWPDREDIDADIRAGRMGIRSIAARYKVSKGMVERHKKCLGVVGGPVNGSIAKLDEPEPEVRLPGEDQGEDVSTVEEYVPKTTKDSKQDSEQDSETVPSVEIVNVERDGKSGLARARVFKNPKELFSWSDRVEYVADLIASGQWHGRPTARRLQDVWGYETISTPWRMHREAHTALHLQQGPLQARAFETVERLRRLGRQARRADKTREAIVAEVEAAKIEGTYANARPADTAQADQRATMFWQRMVERLERDGNTEGVASMKDEAAIIAAESTP